MSRPKIARVLVKTWDQLESAEVFRRGALLLLAAAILAILFAAAPAVRQTNEDAAAIEAGKLPSAYRDWKLITVAREEGSLDDIRAVLGNDIAIKAYREGKPPFPEGTIIARLAWSYEASEENNKTFGMKQSFVAGHPKNGVQFMVKDSAKYAATGGWKYAQFDDGKPLVDAAQLKNCFECHKACKDHDFVFANYAR